MQALNPSSDLVKEVRASFWPVARRRYPGSSGGGPSEGRMTTPGFPLFISRRYEDAASGTHVDWGLSQALLFGYF